MSWTEFSFGSTTSPEKFEPLARVITYLVQRLSRNRELIAKHKVIIDKVKYCESPDTIQLFVQAKIDAINNGIEVEQENTHTIYTMFVDDSLFCEISILMSQVMASSIEGISLIFGVDDVTASETSLSMDKFSKPIAPTCVSNWVLYLIPAPCMFVLQAKSVTTLKKNWNTGMKIVKALQSYKELFYVSVSFQFPTYLSESFHPLLSANNNR